MGSICNWWHGGLFYPTPPAPRIGAAPLEVLHKKDGVELVFCGVEWSYLRCLGNFLWSGVKFGGVKWSQMFACYPKLIYLAGASRQNQGLV